MKRTLFLLLCVLVLLAACAKQKTVEPTLEATREAAATATRRPTKAPATQVPRPTHTPTASATPTRTRRPTATPTLTRTPIPTPTRYVRATATSPATPTPAPAGPSAPRPPQAPPPTLSPPLEVLEDKDPGPPFVITVSANRALAESVYLVSGMVRNDSAETYEAIGVLATFYDAEGFSFGPLDTRCPCTLLAPGESCPFLIEANLRRPTAVLLHPQGRPSDRQSAPMALSGVTLKADGLDSLRLTGVATNQNPFKVKNPTVMGALIDGYGQMVSLGYTYVTVEDIEPGVSVPFSMRVKHRPHVRYQTYVQAERDWQ